MKILTLHSDYIKFKAGKKALKSLDIEDKKEEKHVKDSLVVFTAVEKGDTEDQIKSLVTEVTKIAKQVNVDNIVLYPYAHLSSNLGDPKSSLEMFNKTFKELKKVFKKVEKAPFGFYKEFEIKVKGHPLAELSRSFTSNNKETVGKKVPVKNQSSGKIILDRRNLPKNDHRILGEDLKIFYLADEVGPGLPLWLPNGEAIRHELIEYMRSTEKQFGYKHVSTPHITKGKLYEATGHIPYYADSMYPPMNLNGVDYYLKPMNCPHHHMIYRKLVDSYRDLPLRMAEAGSVYRNELSGVTYGIMRVLSMTQNDAHVYVSPNKLKEEFLNVLKMFEEVYKTVGIKKYWYRLSLPDFKKNPDKYIGDPKIWEKASEDIRKAMKSCGRKFKEEKGEAAFYGPKIDVQLKNAQGKEESIATSQVDIVIPQRLKLKYKDSKGKDQTPIVIHHAVLGSYERFVGYLLEQTSGALPTWLSPTQVRIINFTDRNNKYGEKILKEIKEAIPNIRIDTDFDSVPLGGKIRDAMMMKIPYVIVVGDKEESENKVAVRKLGSKNIESMETTKFINQIKSEIDNRK